MSRTLGKIVIRIFPLPPRVTGRALEAVAETVAAVPGDVAVVLDFRQTEHLDFRALRRFARRLRGMKSLAGPVRLVGLNPYCLQIVRFTLDVRDWDLFAQETGEAAPPAPRGNGATRMPLRGRSGRIEAGPGALLWPPCPN